MIKEVRTVESSQFRSDGLVGVGRAEQNQGHEMPGRIARVLGRVREWLGHRLGDDGDSSGVAEIRTPEVPTDTTPPGEGWDSQVFRHVLRQPKTAADLPPSQE